MNEKPTYEELEQRVRELHQAEKALKESEERFRLLFDNSADAHVLYKGDQFIDCNASAIQMLGFNKREDLLALHPADISPQYQPDGEASRDKADSMIALAFERGSHHFEWLCKRADGSDLLLDVLLNAIRIGGEVLIHAVWRDITEQKQAEEALREAQLRQNEAIKAGNVGLWDWDLKTNQVHYSAEWKRQIGCEEHEITDDFEEWRSRVHPDDLELTLKEVNQSIAEKRRTHKVEFRFRHKDGSYRWILAQASLIFDETGRPIRMLGSHVDMTERKLAEEELKKSERLHTEAQRVAKIGHWALDSPSGTPVWSDEIFHIFDLDPSSSEPSFAAHKDIIHEGDWDLLNRSIQELSSHGTPFDIEFRILKGNGEIGWMHAIGSAERDDEGHVTRMFGTAQDISDRRRIELALQESEEKYRLLVEKADEAIFIAQDDIIKFPNPKTLELTGYSKEELGTIPFADLIHPEDRKMVVERYRRRLNGENPPSDYAFRIINKANSVLWVQNNVAPTTWDGRPATINLLRDISEKRRLEEQLHQSQKMEVIATLTGGIAHDYNNLLSIIVGNLGLAQQDAKPGSEQAGFLHEAEKAARKVGDLTHELMALSRGGGPVKEQLSVVETLNRATEEFPAESDISIEKSIPDELWSVPHDARKMGAVFRNVMTNALEAMPDGGSLTISAQNLRVEDGDGVPGLSVKPGDYVRISIQDNGSGILEANLDKIFDPYFSTKEMGTQKGMGLGLATAHAIVKKHGGDIIVQSTPDVGTTVTIYLPAQSEEGEGKDGKPVSAETKATAADEQAPIGRILLMDDEEMLRNLARHMLKQLGYAVETVKDGIEAIEVYKDHLNLDDPFDAVILDLTIKGGMGGEDALKELLKIDPDARAIVCSGYFNDPVMTDFEDYGFKAAMAKPYEIKDIKEALEKTLDRYEN